MVSASRMVYLICLLSFSSNAFAIKLTFLEKKLIPCNTISSGTQDALAIGVGAVCGALARHQVGRIAADKIASNPERLSHLTGWHTAGINIFGSFLLGTVFSLPVSKPSLSTSVPVSSTMGSKFVISPRTKLLLGTGFCGSFTTFSTFSVDVVNMMGKEGAMRAFSYVCLNNVGGFGAALSGMTLVRKLL